MLHLMPRNTFSIGTVKSEAFWPLVYYLHVFQQINTRMFSKLPMLKNIILLTSSKISALWVLYSKHYVQMKLIIIGQASYSVTSYMFLTINYTPQQRRSWRISKCFYICLNNFADCFNLFVVMETRHLIVHMCRSESSQSHENRSQSGDSGKACSKLRSVVLDKTFCIE